MENYYMNYRTIKVFHIHIAIIYIAIRHNFIVVQHIMTFFNHIDAAILLRTRFAIDIEQQSQKDILNTNIDTYIDGWKIMKS